MLYFSGWTEKLSMRISIMGANKRCRRKKIKKLLTVLLGMVFAVNLLLLLSIIFGVSEKIILDTLQNHFAYSEPRREILYNSAKGVYLLDDTLSRFLTSSEILTVFL